MLGWRRRLVVGGVGPLSVSMLLSISMLALGGAAWASPVPWHPVSVPQPQERTSHELDAVSCPSAAFCMAVGASLDASDSEGAPVAETFNGQTWSLRHPVTVGSTTEFTGVSCLTATSCTVVGASTAGGGHGTPLAEHWDGKTWRVEATKPPAGGGQLQSVSCPSASTCVATGLAETGAGGNQIAGLAERWRSGGAGWTITTTPQPAGGSLLSAVSCPSVSHCVAVGAAGYSQTTKLRDLVEIWDGTHWTSTGVPSPRGLAGLSSVSCATTTSCVATGNVQTSSLAHPTATSLVDSGSTWTVHAVPQPAGSKAPAGLDGVACLSPTSCTAVGFATYGAQDIEGAVVEHWNGHTWGNRTVSASRTIVSSFASVSCPSASVCYAAGATAGTNDGLDVLIDQGPPA
jgi:hypothetical protein